MYDLGRKEHLFVHLMYLGRAQPSTIYGSSMLCTKTKEAEGESDHGGVANVYFLV